MKELMSKAVKRPAPTPPEINQPKKLKVDTMAFDAKDLIEKNDLFVRIEDNHHLKDIPATVKSDKAFNMDLGGARHLFSLFDGLGYPAKKIDAYYHIFSNTIAQHIASFNGETYAPIKIKQAQFPGHFGNIAARSEWRVSQGTLKGKYVLSIPVSLVDIMLHKSNTVISNTCIYFQQILDMRTIRISLDLSHVKKELLGSHNYTSQPRLIFSEVETMKHNNRNFPLR